MYIYTPLLQCYTVIVIFTTETTYKVYYVHSYENEMYSQLAIY